jgi:hypothetical protein
MIPRLWFLISILWTGICAFVVLEGIFIPSTNIDLSLGIVVAIAGAAPWVIRRAARWVFLC